MTAPERTSIESLLAHRGWVRDLALRLAGDPSVADDLEQDVWMAALRHPPRPEGERGSLRAWLGTVLRNRVRERHRGATRRTVRETAAARPESIPGADELASRADAHRHVVSTVLALDEPYRATVLFLFFEGLSPKETAARMDVPIDTVRTRARRALATLRSRLDRDHGGDRRAWAVGILGADVWRRLAEGGSTAAAGGTMAATIAAGGVMANATKAGLLAGGLILGIALTLGAQAVTASDAAPEQVTRTATVPADSVPARPAVGDAATPVDSTSLPDAESGDASPGDSARSDPPTFPPYIVSALPPEVSDELTGRVLDEQGRPLEGVTIRAWVRARYASSPRLAGPPALPSEAESVQRARENHRWDAATRREAVSSADGSYTLTGLRDTEYQLTAYLAGWELRPGPGRRGWNGRPGQTFDFRGERRIPLEVLVLGPSEQPVPEATLRWKPSGQRGGGSAAHWTPESPVVYLGAGEIDVTAEVRGDDPLRSEPVSVSLDPRSEPDPIVLHLKGEPRIRGTVRISRGQEWEHLRVLLVKGQLSGPITLHTLRNVPHVTARPPDYRFEVDRIAPGDYTLVLSHDGQIVHDRAIVTVGHGTSVCSLTMPELSSDVALRVRVMDESGRPIEDPQFRVEVRAGSALSGGGGVAHLQSDGTFLIPFWGVNARQFGEENVETTLIVSSKAHGVLRIPFERGRDARLEARFSKPANAVVHVSGYDARALGDRVFVTLVAEGADSPSTAMTTATTGNGGALDPRGMKTFGPLVPGRHLVQLWLRMGDYRAMQITSRKVEVAAGANRINVDFPALADLTVKLPDGAKGEILALIPGRAPGNYYYRPRTGTDETGTVTWKGLPPGPYVVRRTRNGKAEEMHVALTSSVSLTFAPVQLDGLSLTVTDPSGKLARAGFQTGDVVIRIDGNAFRTLQGAQFAGGEARDKPSVEFVVLRGGSEKVVRGRGDLLNGFFEVGGHWEPITR